MANEQNIPNGLRLGNTSENSGAELIAVLGAPDANGHRIVGYILRSDLQGIPLSGTVEGNPVTGDIELGNMAFRPSESTAISFDGDIISLGVLDLTSYELLSTGGSVIVSTSGSSLIFNYNLEDISETASIGVTNAGILVIDNKFNKGIKGSVFFNKQNDPNAFAQLGDIAVSNSTATPLSLSDLNTEYPTQPTGFKVICPVINLIYIKDSLTTWQSINTTTVT